MLHEFLTVNRQELIHRCRDKVISRFAPYQAPPVVTHGASLLLQQIADTLRCERLMPERHFAVSEPATAPTEIGRAAALHGAELLRLGYSIDQVVHDYGDVCQSVTELAVERHAPISTDEFRTLNRCLDNAIADAVTAFGNARQIIVESRSQDLQSSLDNFSSEHRCLVDIVAKAFYAIRSGNVGLTGATGNLLMLTLSELQSLAARRLPHIHPTSEAGPAPSQ